MLVTNIPSDTHSQRLLALISNLQRILNEAAAVNCHGTQEFETATVEYMRGIHDEITRRRHHTARN